VKVRTNSARLVAQVVSGEVWPPLADRHPYRLDPEGGPFLLPGMGGVTLGLSCGEPATGYAGDHVEPGLSVRHREEGANQGLQFLACVGNRARVVTGPGEGAEGFVIGQHAYVLVEMAPPDLERVSVGDEVVVVARGQGLRLLDHGEVWVKNCSPELVERMPGGTLPDGRLEVHVAMSVPPEAVGAGSGMSSEYANADLMGAYAGLPPELSLGTEGLRIGDLVALEDQDHRFGRGRRAGWLSVGVISTGNCLLFGHGPGASTLFTGPTDAFNVVLDPEANLGKLFGRWDDGR
jgi:hypothetical protein